MKTDSLSPETAVVHDAEKPFLTVATPVFHASTVLFPTYAALKEGESDPLNRDRMFYGRMGTPSTRSLEDAITALDGSVGAVLAPSGVASIADVLQCFLRHGDHLLMVDSCYGPTRKFCLGRLADMGVSTTFFDPLCGSGIAELIKPETRMIFLESPGTATFEVQDVPAIAAAARAAGVLTAIDNTWATPLLFDPLVHGVDLAIQSGTKYLNGHADVMFGVTTTRDENLYRRLHHYALATGTHLAPDDAYLARRGLRTLAVRLGVHERNGLALARWLESRQQVSRVLHPALPGCGGHEVFKRDFRGASGLFACIVNNMDERRLPVFLDGLTLFGMGFSWGGFESLILPMEPARSIPGLELGEGQVLLRIHAGLEAIDDLIADLDAAFKRCYMD